MRFAWQIILPVIVLASAPANAQASHERRFTNEMTGDWDGWRTWLLGYGFNFTLGYTTETAGNAQGGTKQSVRYTDQWALGMTVDLDKVLGLHDATLQMTITDRNGRNLSSDENLGSLQQVQEVYGRGQTWRTTQLWFEQAYFGKQLDWKIGRMTVGEDFASFSCDFMNLTFCGAQPGNIVGSYWYNWPVSQWGTRFKTTMPNFGYFQIGAYEVNPGYLGRAYAFTLDEPPGATGALIPVEFGWLPSFGAARLPGSYKFGWWYNTSGTADVFENAHGQPLAVAGGPPRIRNGAYGGYVNFLQKLTNPAPDDPKRGLSAFLNVSIADRRTAVLDDQIALGFTYDGPFDFRPQDDIGIAFGRTNVNGRVARGEELENASGLGPVPVQSAEYAAELYYTVHATDWLNLRPDFQYVHQPGGISQEDDIILGLKTALAF